MNLYFTKMNRFLCVGLLNRVVGARDLQEGVEYEWFPPLFAQRTLLMLSVSQD